MSLPVAAIAAELMDSLQQSNRVVLSAPPGAGKSTWLPLYLLQHPSYQQQKILLLEPRRLAAKSIASYMASQLHQQPGQTIGYQVRYERKVSKETRLLIVTEGILTRMIQQDPELSAYDLVIFDEFHERSLHADLALALALEVQQLRDSLRLLLMSATLDTERLAQALNARVVQSEGRSYPVAIRYQAPTREPLWQQVAKTCWQLVQQETGSILAFLPGQAEIEKAAEWLQQQTLPAGLSVLPLLGSLPLSQQQRAIAAPEAGQRKIVLATNVAETSLTIEGIRLVVDSGVCRKARFYSRHGVMKLETVAISQAAAIQRAGRAGRLEPGLCVRLDTEALWQRKASYTPADICDAELTGLRLDCAGWGAQVDDLFWLDRPPAANLHMAEQLLQQLGALSETLKITARGKAMLALGTDPRLAAMLCAAQQLEQAGEQGAVWLAALLAVTLEQGRDRKPLWPQLQRLQQERGAMLQQAESWLRQLGGQKTMPSSTDLFILLLCRAYPDRLGVKRGKGYLLANGAGAVLPADHELQSAPFLIISQLQLTAEGLLIRQAEPLSLAQIQAIFVEQLHWQSHSGFDDKSGRFISEQQLRLGACVLQRKNSSETIGSEQRTTAWLAYLQQKGLARLPWQPDSQQLLARIRLWASLESASCEQQWSDEALLQDSTVWLGSWLASCESLADLAKLPLKQALLSRLSYAQQQQLKQLLPERWQAPTGNQLPIDYLAEGGPQLAVRIQEVFGQLDSPVLANGRIKLTLELLSPARRPLQRTQDLASFWKNAYSDVRKEMKGRYPKHYWPEQPADAMPTSRTRKAMQP
ncbi:MAG: ATP-dependent helicase HrpB [Alkalimonas sp.]|nr:ATP-dependent helicase HrpB [Alkalimonas sp.]